MSSSNIRGTVKSSAATMVLKSGASTQLTITHPAGNSAARVLTLPSNDADYSLPAVIHGGTTSKAVQFTTSGATSSTTLNIISNITANRAFTFADGDTVIGGDSNGTDVLTRTASQTGITNKVFTALGITAGSTIDTAASGTLGIGNTNATTITIGQPGQAIVLDGDVSISGNLDIDEVQDDTFNIVDEGDETKRLNFSLGGATTSTRTTITASQTADRVLTLPDATDTLVGRATTDTLTNKTLTSPILTTPQINDTSADHQYIFAVSELVADRTVTLPLLTGNDEFTFNDHAQVLTNKELTNPTITENGTITTAASGTLTIGSANSTTVTLTDGTRSLAIASAFTFTGGHILAGSDGNIRIGQTGGNYFSTIYVNNLESNAPGSMSISTVNTNADIELEPNGTGRVLVRNAAGIGLKPSASFNYTILKNSGTNTADRVLNFDVNDGDKTITLGGDFTTSGAYNLTLTQTAATSVTLPTTGTLATLDGAESLTNKTEIALANQSPLRLYEQTGNGSNYMALTAPDAVTTSTTLKLPDGPGTNGYALTTNGTGTLSWSAVLTNPMTTTGDIIYSSDNSGTPARLAAGTDNHILRMNGTTPNWEAGTATSSTAGFVSNMELGSFSSTITGASSSSITIYYSKINNIVNLWIPGFSGTATAASRAFLSLTNLPSGMRPLDAHDIPMCVTDAGVLQNNPGKARIHTTGDITIYRNIGASNFTNAAVYGWTGFNLTYLTS